VRKSFRVGAHQLPATMNALTGQSLVVSHGWFME